MRRHVPYRGDGFPTDFEPRKRFVNLRKLRWRLAKTIVGIVAVFGTITFFVLQENSHSDVADKTYVAALVILWILALILIASILDLNKFRKGRDVDVPDKAEKEPEQQNEDNKES